MSQNRRKGTGLETSSPSSVSPIYRQRVVDAICEASQRRVALLAAPAGYGKSVAICQFIVSERIKCIRLTVSRGSDSLLAFLREFLMTLGDLPTTVGGNVTRAYEVANQDPNMVHSLALWLATRLGDYEGTVIIDDLHWTGSDRRVLEVLSETIIQSSPRTKWLIATRGLLDVPYASWIAYGLMNRVVDEKVLALSRDEALEAVERMRPGTGSGGVDDILSWTRGWPAAFAFRLTDVSDPHDSSAVPLMAFDVLYNYLALQVLSEFTDQECQFMMETSVLDRLEASALEIGGMPNASAILNDLRHRAAFLTLEAPGVYRYHELFRNFLEHRLSGLGSEHRRGIFFKMANVCELSGQIADALRLRMQINDTQNAHRILIKHGTQLFDAGQIELVDAALSKLSLRDLETELLLLRARVKSSYGQPLEADSLYRRAMEESKSPEKFALAAWRYAAFLSRRLEYTRALDIIGRVSQESTISDGIRGLVGGMRASILSCLGELSAAVEAIETSLAVMLSVDDDGLSATLFSYAGFVNIKAGRLSEAREYGVRCLEGALRVGNYGLASIACTQLYNVALDLGDTSTAKRSLQMMLDSASRSGDLQMRRVAVMNSFDQAGMRGDRNDLARLRDEVSRFRFDDPKTWSECVAPTLALEAAWRGDFESACLLLSEAPIQGFDDRQLALREAETLVYELPLISGSAERLERVQAKVETLSMRLGTRRDFRSRRAALLVAVCRGLVVGDAEGRAVVAKVSSEHGSRSAARPARSIGDGLHLSRLTSDIMRSENAGWRAAIVAVISAYKGAVRGPLTKTEREIARLIADGHTSKEVAELSSRSVLTVESHVRSIIAKLGGGNRRTAIRRASELGWL